MGLFVTFFAFGFLAPSFSMATPSRCGFPDRAPATVWSSTQFYQEHRDPSPAREIAVVQQVLTGNVPEPLRKFEPLTIDATVDGQKVKIGLQVAPDYLMIGNDSDFVRAPLTNYAAQYLASELGFSLPTAYLVDQIYDQAAVQLIPQPTDWYKHDTDMRLGPNYVLFNAMIESQRGDRWGLIGGEKKDVVLTNRLDDHPDRVAIYGWQQPGNLPIQPLSTVHGYFYEDYSHGIRFLGPWVTVQPVDGGPSQTISIFEALTDPQLGSILNGGQGPIHDVRAGRMCSAEFMQAFGLTPQDCPPQPRLCDGPG